MIRTFCSWIGSFTATRPRRPRPGRPSAGDATRTGEHKATPLTGIRRAVQDALVVVEQQFEATRLVDERLARIEGHVGEAWRERERLLRDYYCMVRAVLSALDDCRAIAGEGAEAGRVQEILEKVLKEQGVQQIPAAVGDRFRPETQCCEETQPSAEVPPGTVLEILEPGYQRCLADGTTDAIRSVRVVVSKAPEELKERESHDHEQVHPDRHRSGDL